MLLLKDEKKVSKKEEEKVKDTQPVNNSSKSPKNEEKKDRNNRFLKGLCINCQNLKTCSMAKPDSGIWHCEHYN